MFNFIPNTPFKVYYKTVTYVKNEGNTVTWKELDSDGYKTFYCEWKGTYGDRAISAEALGVKESATIRTFYNPTIYEILRSREAIIIKNGGSLENEIPNKSNPNLFELWGSVDNVMEENKFMEFRVRRYQGI